MVTEMLASCVNTMNLILQEVKYNWNVWYNGNVQHKGYENGAELLSEVENGVSSIA
jgi:hypothetical protein